MNMPYLVATSPAVGEVAEWADRGEPVVPWFPATLRNVFLGCRTFRPATHALATGCCLDPDELAAGLAKQYPGLPAKLCENYVLRTAQAARQLPTGTLVRIFITADSARLQDIKTDTILTLWEQQPFK